MNCKRTVNGLDPIHHDCPKCEHDLKLIRAHRATYPEMYRARIG